jgi:TonB-linked SusC/RagA family outer membrane protein
MRQKLMQSAVLFLVLLGFLFTGSPVFAQTRTVIGRVTSGGVGISGVSVQIKGTNKAVLTDADGNYKLAVNADDAVLVFSSIGYTPQEFPANRPNVNVSLVESDRVLSEVVVTALGIKREAKRIGYSIQEVKGEELIKARDPNVFNQLEGKVAGLDIGTSPEMYTRPNIVLRGNKDVLIVVDGVPVSSDTWNVNADDIESVNVLKGPNAAALYGFRGQNGAIIITTKLGSHAGKGWEVNFNSSNMVQDGFTVIPKDQYQFGRGSSYEYEYTDGLQAGETLYDYGQRLAIWGPRTDGQLVAQYNSPYNATTGTWTKTPYLTKGTNNLAHFLQPGLLSTDNVSLSTSGSNYDIRISYSHLYQKGQAPSTKINSDNLNLAADYTISPKLKADASLNMNEQYTPNIPDADYGPNSYVYMFNVYGPGDYDVRDLKNYYKGPQGIPGLNQYNENYGRSNNPYFMAHEWLRGKTKTDIYGYARLTYNFSKDFSLAFRSQITTWNQLLTEKVPAGTVLNEYLPWYYPGWYGDYREDRRALTENNTDLLLTYKKTFSGFFLNANLGTSERSFEYASNYATTKDLAIPGVYSLTNTQNPALVYNFGSRMQVYSGYYAVDLSYKNYVYLSTTGRVDNLSTLPSNNNTFFYPSVSLATSVGDYVHLPASVDLLKFRVSFADVKGGLTKAQIGSAYNGLTGNTLDGGLLGYGFEQYTAYDGPTYQNQSAYSLTTYYNNQTSVSYSATKSDPNLKPFDVKSYEAGLEYQMFKGRVGLNLTYYESLNGPLIYALPLPSSTTYQTQLINAVTSLKKGWEAILNLTPVRSRDFSWNVLVNWSTYRETLHKIGNGQSSIEIGSGGNGTHVFQKGDRLDAFYSTAFVRDGSGDIVWSNGGPLSAPSGISNYKKLGYLDPNFSAGINNRFTYKNWSLSFQLDGRFGGKIYDDVYYHSMNGGTAVESDQGAYGIARNQEWLSTNQGTVAPTPGFTGKGVVITGGTPTYSGGQITNLKNVAFATNTTPTTVQSLFSSSLGSNFDEYFMVKRTFAKLREVRLTYNLTQKMLGKKSVFKSASVALIGRNLLYFAQRKDFDIDQYASGFDIQSQSLNGGGGGQTGTSSDVTLSSSTSRWYGVNFNLGF